MAFTQAEIRQLPEILSAPRFSTYLSESGGNPESALELYEWNLRLSSAFIVPIQICEVSTRNAIVRAIAATYGPNWPWEQGFTVSLPQARRGAYGARENLERLQRLQNAGKIVAELKFVFWEKMLTARHDPAIWNAHLRMCFPNTDRRKSVQDVRGELYQNLEKIRELRNRIAHHEPIFRRHIREDLDRIADVVSQVNEAAAVWMGRVETVTDMIAARPAI